MIKICLFGKHSNRTPFSYPEYRRIFESGFKYVLDPKHADILILGFTIDLDDAFDEVYLLQKNAPDLKIVVLSEEPLWDILWTQSYPLRQITFTKSGKYLTFYHLNHQNSKIFDFEKLPYFITTENKYFQLYQYAFSRNIKNNSGFYKNTWGNSRNQIAFVLEKRSNMIFAKKINKDLFCLSKFRSDLAEKFWGRDNALHLGQGWRENTIKRQNLLDWHFDKFTLLDGECKFISAIENCHQGNYLTEKLFDAYASMGIPVYFSLLSHQVNTIKVSDSYLNLNVLDVDFSYEKIQSFQINSSFLDAYVGAQLELHRLFSDFQVLMHERFRVAAEIKKELEHIL
jgi:hypothetical protein